MTTIVYGKTVRPITHAAGRRKERRKVEAIRRELIESRIDKALGLKPEKRKELTQYDNLSKLKITQLADSNILNEYKDQLDYFRKKYERQNHRIWYSKPKTEHGITARLRPTTEYKHWKQAS